MASSELVSGHYEDIEDLISAVEREFEIKFNKNEFENIKS